MENAYTANTSGVVMLTRSKLNNDAAPPKDGYDFNIKFSIDGARGVCVNKFTCRRFESFQLTGSILVVDDLYEGIIKHLYMYRSKCPTAVDQLGSWVMGQTYHLALGDCRPVIR